MGNNNQLLPRGQSEATGFDSQAGREWCFKDLDYGQATQPHRSQHDVRCRLVKNSSGVALLPGYAVSFKADTNRSEVDGYARTTAQSGIAIVDEFLPSDGVPDGEYFWVALDGGPAMCKMPASEVADVSEDDILVALTAAASTHSTTAGRVTKQDLTGATDVLANQIQGAIGRALSAVSSSSTNNDILVFLKSKWD